MSKVKAGRKKANPKYDIKVMTPKLCPDSCPVRPGGELLVKVRVKGAHVLFVQAQAFDSAPSSPNYFLASLGRAQYGGYVRRAPCSERKDYPRFELVVKATFRDPTDPFGTVAIQRRFRYFCGRCVSIDRKK